MAHRTQLHLNEMQYQYLKHVAQTEKKSIAQVIRDWIDEKRSALEAGVARNDSLLKARGLFASGDPSLADRFDEVLYCDSDKE